MLLRRVVDRHDFGELDQRPFCRAIGGAPGAADPAELRGDEDDRAAAAGDHQRQNGAAQQKGAGQVHVEHAPPIGGAGLEDRAARIVRRRAADQDVETAERLMRRCGGGERLGLVGNIAAARHRSPAGLGHQPGRLRRGFGIDIDAADGSAGLGIGQRDRAADAAARAADQRRLARKLHRGPPECRVTASPCRHRPRWSGR